MSASLDRPVVSVVTGVFNGAAYLESSVESVLAQTGVALELVVVDDGSTDGSSGILARLAARDPRLRVIRQENEGLTRSLVRGCAEARGTFIARHDADDLSLPGRLAAQAHALERDTSLTLVASWVHCIGPEGELLFDVRRAENADEATRAMLESEAGPVHGSAMFRKADYERAGAYRAEFRVAQDWDLWLRLLDRGRCAFVPEFLYAHRIQADSISARRKMEQERSREVARQCRELRTRGVPEDAALQALAGRLRSARPTPAGSGAYFIGKCLLDRRDPRAVAYLRRSVRENPRHLRARFASLLAERLCRTAGPTVSPLGEVQP
jgi:glycosyltransferase involved in cell wall biosynthesis